MADTQAPSVEELRTRQRELIDKLDDAISSAIKEHRNDRLRDLVMSQANLVDKLATLGGL